MSEPTTLPRARPQAGIHAQVSVDDYLGVSAGDAARALRRAGLRPALDRQVGHAPETVGLVVAQDPAGGQMQPRGAMVTLYVAAPGPGEAPDQADEPGAPARPQQSPPETRAGRASFSYLPPAAAAGSTPFVLRSPAPRASSRGVRRGGLAAEEPRERESLGAGGAGAGERRPAWLATRQAEEVQADTSPAEVEVPMSMRDAFLHSAPRTRRRLYPREPASVRAITLLASARRRWARVGIALVLLGWLTFAFAHRADTSQRHASSPASARGARALPAPALVPAPHVHKRRRHRRATRHRRRERPNRPRAASTPTRPLPAPTQQAAPTPQRPARRAASAGGPFSP